MFGNVLDWMQRYIFDPFLLALLPDRCAFCNTVTRINTFVCDDCKPRIRWQTEPFCAKCGHEKAQCSCKKNGRRRWDGAAAPWIYEEASEGITGGCVRLLKSSFYERSAIYMGKEIAAHVRKVFPLTVFDTVMPVPMFPQDEFERGYSQSVWIAQAVAKELGVPFENRLRKIRKTQPQKTLRGSERTVNLRGAFDLDEMYDAPGKTVLLVDDLLTTGSTLEECTTILKIYGVEAVYVATACITPNERK